MPLKGLRGTQRFLVQDRPLVPRPLHLHRRPGCHDLVLVPALCPGSGKQSDFRGTDLGWGLGGFVSSVSTSEGGGWKDCSCLDAAAPPAASWNRGSCHSLTYK